MERNLYTLTEAKQEALSHREATLKESEKIFAEQYLIDWETIRQELDLQKQYEERIGRD